MSFINLIAANHEVSYDADVGAAYIHYPEYVRNAQATGARTFGMSDEA